MLRRPGEASREEWGVHYMRAMLATSEASYRGIRNVELRRCNTHLFVASLLAPSQSSSLRSSGHSLLAPAPPSSFAHSHLPLGQTMAGEKIMEEGSVTVETVTAAPWLSMFTWLVIWAEKEEERAAYIFADVTACFLSTITS